MRGEESGGKMSVADGLAKQASASCEFREAVFFALFDKSNSIDEMFSVGFGKVWERGFACCGGQDESFVKIEVYVKWFSEFGELLQEEQEINVSEHGLGVIDVRRGGSERAMAVVILFV